MTEFLLVGFGGFIGSVSRYFIGGWVHRILNNAWFPYGTIAVNICGCLLIGFLGGISESRQLLASETRLFLFIGVLGGFTTFSSFGYETFMLMRDGETIPAIMNVAAHIILGLTTVWLGNAVSRLI